MITAIPGTSSYLGLTHFNILSSSFKAYTDIDACYEDSRRKIQELEEICHTSGLSGQNSLHIISSLRSQIGWETMIPDLLVRFYKFMFHLIKEPKKKHVQVEGDHVNHAEGGYAQVDVALAAWQLVLPGRFRLLGRWCDFIKNETDLRVVNEDQWRQVLDFSRTVHEDLSNFDSNGAWVILIDEFVDHMKQKNRVANNDYDFSDPSLATLSPHCGVKRRSPDIDVVAEQLSAMPLSSASRDQIHHIFSPPIKKHCGEALLSSEPTASSMLTSPVAAPAVNMHFELPQEFLHNLAAVQTSTRRVVRTRRSGVSDLLNSTVSDALGLSFL